jgi:prepilin-type N-terminal cleavage/methylation domain-containing protein
MMTQEITPVNYVKVWTCRSITMATRKQGIHLRNSRGITLIELIVAFAILAVLAALAIPTYSTYKDLARESAAMTDIRTIELAINGYKAENGSNPANLSQVKYDTLIDPWGNHFEYRQAPGTLEFISGDLGVGTVDNKDFDLWCKGKDGSSGTALSVDENIIVRARSGGFVGLAKNF